MAQKKKNAKTSMTVLGVIIFALAIVGLVSAVRFSAVTIKNLTNDTKLKQQYEEYLSTVVMNDPDTFDDITKAENKQLISIAIWTLLESDIAPDDYKYIKDGMVVPVADVEKTFTELFSTDVTPKHCTVEGGEGIRFKYDSTRKAYIVPVTGVSPIYTPDVVEINKKGTTVILTVAYLASTDWVMNSDGSMSPPSPSKYMKISLREDADGNSYISSVQSAANTDYITVAAQKSDDNEETAAVDAEKTEKSSEKSDK